MSGSMDRSTAGANTAGTPTKSKNPPNSNVVISQPHTNIVSSQQPQQQMQQLNQNDQSLKTPHPSQAQSQIQQSGSTQPQKTLTKNQQQNWGQKDHTDQQMSLQQQSQQHQQNGQNLLKPQNSQQHQQHQQQQQKTDGSQRGQYQSQEQVQNQRHQNQSLQIKNNQQQNQQHQTSNQHVHQSQTSQPQNGQQTQGGTQKTIQSSQQMMASSQSSQLAQQQHVHTQQQIPQSLQQNGQVHATQNSQQQQLSLQSTQFTQQHQQQQQQQQQHQQQQQQGNHQNSSVGNQQQITQPQIAQPQQWQANGQTEQTSQNPQQNQLPNQSTQYSHQQQNHQPLAVPQQITQAQAPQPQKEQSIQNFQQYHAGSQFSHHDQQLNSQSQPQNLNLSLGSNQQQVTFQPQNQQLAQNQQQVQLQPQNVQQWQQTLPQDHVMNTQNQTQILGQFQSTAPQQQLSLQQHTSQQPVFQQQLNNQQVIHQQFPDQQLLNQNQINPVINCQQQQIMQQQVHQQLQNQPVLALQQHLIQPQQVQPQNIHQIYQQHQLQENPQQSLSVLRPSVLFRNATIPVQTTPVSSQQQLSQPPMAVAPAPSSPVGVIKKGRFRVVKGGNSSKQQNTNGTKSDGANTNEGGAKDTDAAVPEQTTVTSTSSGQDGQSVASSVAVSTKKKGRFVVKTGGSVASTLAAGSVAESTITSGSNTANKSTIENAGNINASQSEDKMMPPVSSCQALAPMSASLSNPTGGLSVQQMISPPSYLSPPVTTPQTNQIPLVNQAAPTISTSIPLALSALPSVEIPQASSQHLGLVDVNGQLVVVSQPITAALNNPLHVPAIQTVHQYHHQQGPLPQRQGQTLFVNPTIPVNAGSQQQIIAPASNLSDVSQTHQQYPPQNQVAEFQPTQPPPPLQNQQPQPQPPRISKEHASGTGTLTGAATYPSNTAKPDRVVGNTSQTNICATSGGRGGAGSSTNGRLLGTGGVGKVLHYLETLRVEVAEADKSLASTKSDNRFLRDKNKELEAKNSDLERKLAKEKSLREATESKYRSLLQKLKGQNEPDQSFHSTDKHSSTSEGILTTAMSRQKESDHVDGDTPTHDRSRIHVDDKLAPTASAGPSKKLPLHVAPSTQKSESKVISKEENHKPELKNTQRGECIGELKGSSSFGDSHQSKLYPVGDRKHANISQDQSNPGDAPSSARRGSYRSTQQTNPTNVNPPPSSFPTTTTQQMIDSKLSNSQAIIQPSPSHGSLARQFDPLSSVVMDTQKLHVVPPSVTNFAVCDIAPIRQSAQSYIPTVTSAFVGNQVVPQSQPQTPEKRSSYVENAPLIENQFPTTTHFDPLGTPKSDANKRALHQMQQNSIHPFVTDASQIPTLSLNVDTVSQNGVPTMTHINGSGMAVPVLVPMPDLPWSNQVVPPNAHQVTYGTVQQQTVTQQQHQNPFNYL